MSETRAETISRLEADRAALVDEGMELAKKTQQREKALLKRLKALEAPGAFTDFLVSVKKDGKTIQLKAEGPFDLGEFIKYLEATPRSMKKKVVPGASGELDAVRRELSGLPTKYAQEIKKLETRIYHLDVKIAKMEGAGENAVSRALTAVQDI